MRFNIYGHMIDDRRTEGMTSPVECTHCGDVYDLGTVTVTARYSDCSVWNTPCCGRVADDREWKSLRDFRRLRRSS